MYLLILVSFLHMATIKPEPFGLFNDRDACIAKAALLNHGDPDNEPPPEGFAYACFSLVHPT